MYKPQAVPNAWRLIQLLQHMISAPKLLPVEQQAPSLHSSSADNPLALRPTQHRTAAAPAVPPGIKMHARWHLAVAVTLGCCMKPIGAGVTSANLQVRCGSVRHRSAQLESLVLSCSNHACSSAAQIV